MTHTYRRRSRRSTLHHDPPAAHAFTPACGITPIC
jgi:hypothetical protein